MKPMILALTLAGCAQSLDVPAPSAPQLQTELMAERPPEGCWHQTNLGFFETPCDVDVSSLQRALAARGLYSGAVDGTMNVATRKAVKAYQEPLGLGSETLSLAGARALGLAPVPM